MSELDEIRQKRMQELIARQQMQEGGGEHAQRQMQEAELEKQIKLIITQIMAPEARERLGNIRAARPDFARQIEVLLIQLMQAGKLPSQLSDEQFKAILTSIKSRQRETHISRK